MEISSNAAYASISHRTRVSDEDTSGSVVLLQQERDRLQQAVNHLEKSNRELHAALVREGEDPDYRQAIGENIVTIAKFKGIIQRLDAEIIAARESVSHEGSSSSGRGSQVVEAMRTGSLGPENMDVESDNSEWHGDVEARAMPSAGMIPQAETGGGMWL